jgi:tripartite-type tricarboxylate transporter receptor subunit TctC
MITNRHPNRRLTLAFALLSLCSVGPVAADDYPSRPITLIVPFAPGGFNDISGRLIAQKVSEELGQTIVVDNRPGAAGAIGANAVARARPDGYTLGFFSSGPLASNLSLYKSLSYDPIKDFAPITRATSTPNVLVVSLDVPAKTLPEFVAHLKKNPGKINYGTSGNGSTPHLSAVLLESMAGVRMTHVPYKGGSQTNIGLQNGEVQMAFSPIVELMPLIKAGKVRALAVTSTARSPLLPDVPAVAEQYPGYEIQIWNGVVAPAGTPQPVVDRLNAAIRKAMETSELKAKLMDLGLTPSGMAPAAFGGYIESEIASFARLIKLAGVVAE